MGTKWERRRELRARRREIAARRDLASDGARLAEHAMPLLDRYAALTSSTALAITGYEPIPGEPDVSALLHAAHERGVEVRVPITLPDLDLDWARWTPEGAGEPLGKEAVSDVTVAFIPGLSVDQGGTRMGQGGGGHDRTLPRIRSGAPVICVLHPEEDRTEPPLPRDEHDVPVDAVLTAAGVRWIGDHPGR